jgi:hypothetical protein
MLTPRVLLLIYDPIIESPALAPAPTRLSRLLNWHDPDQLCAQYIADVAEASHGEVHYTIVARVALDAYPVKVDGFRYDDESYLRAWRARAGFHQPDTADYAAILRDADFLARLEADQVDELWVMAFPYAGLYESCTGGRGAIWCNGPIIPNTAHIPRRFVVMGFNYERGVGEMLENLGHRAESIMAHVFAGLPEDRPRVSAWQRLLAKLGLAQPAQADVDLNGNLWAQFTRHERTHPGLAACGNVHFAPNSATDYDWGNPRPVLSNADDWLNYPHFTGQRRLMTCADWGNGDIRLHHLWWLKHFPHVEGTTPTGRLNNWWRYVVGLEF